MPAELSRLRSRAAVEAALDQFESLGRAAFLERYGFGRSRDFLVRNPRTGTLCDSKAIVGAAYGFEHPEHGPLSHREFSGGEATVVPRLRALGFEVVKIGEDWTQEEVSATVASYFEMLRHEALQQRYKKTDYNLELRQVLNRRSKASVELKHQNVSAVLDALGLPFIPGYKPRGNSQLLLRKEVQRFVLANPALVEQIVDALEDNQSPSQKRFKAVVVDPPQVRTVAEVAGSPRVYLPRKVDYASRDESNRRLGREGEQWVIEYEQHRLKEAGMADLFSRLDWVSDRLGDGAGYDILSFESATQRRCIEVKTTNGPYAQSFILSRNELDFSHDAGDEFYLYRVFDFRKKAALYILQGDISKHVHLEPLDYRASFRRVVS